MAEPSVTVLIPFKRGGNEEWLREAIGSLPRGQRYLLLENDGELADALNEGLRRAGTEFCFRLDADDRAGPEIVPWLAEMAWDVDVAYSSLCYYDADWKQLAFQKASPFCPYRLERRNYIPGTALFRTKAALEVGGFRDLPVLEDWDLWVRMARAGMRFKPVPEAVYLYRRHEGARNMSRSESPEEVHARMRAEIVGEPAAVKATWYTMMPAASVYWRCQVPARALPGQVIDWPDIKVIDPEEAEFEFPDHEGVAVWQVPGDGARALLMAHMQEKGIPVLLESDDNYFDASPLGNPGWLKHEFAAHKPTLLAHQKIAANVCDGIVTTTETLAKRYRKLNPNVFVCPNSIDPSDWSEPGREGPLRVGWFASPSHRDDAPLIRRALEWASRQPDVEVVTIGLDPGWDFPRRQIPWSNDPGVYRRLIGQLDLGLAPLRETPWAVCRSDLKLLEYGMVEAAVVCSDVAPFAGWDVRKARTPKEFLHHVQDLVRHPEQLRAEARALRERVLAERTIDKTIWRWEEALEEVAAVCRR